MNGNGPDRRESPATTRPADMVAGGLGPPGTSPEGPPRLHIFLSPEFPIVTLSSLPSASGVYSTGSISPSRQVLSNQGSSGP